MELIRKLSRKGSKYGDRAENKEQTQNMEDSYAVTSKYNESWLQKKDKRKFEEYWVVLKSTLLFIFKDQNTHAKEQFVGSIEIRDDTEIVEDSSTKEGKCGFRLRNGKESYLFRAHTDILRKRWLHAIRLSRSHLPPGPLPGDLDFMPGATSTNNNVGNRPEIIKRSSTIGSETNGQPPSSHDYYNARPLMPVPASSTRSTPTDSDDSDGYEHADDQEYDGVFFANTVDNLTWYYGECSRGEAEDLMRMSPVGSFLLRDSGHSSDGQAYTVTVKDTPRFKHHRLIKYGNEYAYEGSEHILFQNPADAVTSLMRHTYSELNPRPVKRQSSLNRRYPGDGKENVTAPFKEFKKRPSFSAENHRPPSGEVHGFDFQRTSSTTLPQSKPFQGLSARPLPTVPSGEAINSVEYNPDENTYVNNLALRFQEAFGDKPARHSVPSMTHDQPPPPIPERTRRVSEPAYENYNPAGSHHFERANRRTGKYDPYRHVES